MTFYSIQNTELALASCQPNWDRSCSWFRCDLSRSRPDLYRWATGSYTRLLVVCVSSRGMEGRGTGGICSHAACWASPLRSSTQIVQDTLPAGPAGHHKRFHGEAGTWPAELAVDAPTRATTWYPWFIRKKIRYIDREYVDEKLENTLQLSMSARKGTSRP
jgi:hypothetical protein